LRMMTTDRGGMNVMRCIVTTIRTFCKPTEARDPPTFFTESSNKTLINASLEFLKEKIGKVLEELLVANNQEVRVQGSILLR
jgi:hypothetical protein